MTKIYITKYALSTGIFSHEADVSLDGTSAKFKHKNGGNWFLYGKDFQLTPHEALARAEEMRIRKLQSLDKQIKKVSAIKFEIK